VEASALCFWPRPHCFQEGSWKDEGTVRNSRLPLQAHLGSVDAWERESITCNSKTGLEVFQKSQPTGVGSSELWLARQDVLEHGAPGNVDVLTLASFCTPQYTSTYSTNLNQPSKPGPLQPNGLSGPLDPQKDLTPSRPEP
jgi:hypothetical protein